MSELNETKEFQSYKKEFKIQDDYK